MSRPTRVVVNPKADKPPVTIFGAGIAGLTAAHELAIRGFDVQVIDKDYNAEHTRDSYDRGIGGMARSQFGIAPGGTIAGKEMERLWTATELLSDVAIRFKSDGTPLDPKRADMLIDQLIKTIGELRKHQLRLNRLQLLLHVKPADDGNQDLPPKDPRIDWVRAKLKGAVTPTELASMLIRWDSDRDDQISFQPNGHVVAGEHGFRFFPSFYRHLFDTMKRTPILNPRASERTKANTYQNLVPSEGLGFARDGKAVSFMVPRRKLSAEAMRKTLREVLEQLGYTGSDMSRFGLKLFKYMSSGTKRRAGEYEHISWGQFLEVERYSDISRAHIEFGPQMSAALRGSASDARTQGNITMQLLADQFQVDSHADFTLAGPTSGAWFDHWHDFLKDQGVTFARGELKGFTPNAMPIVEPAPDNGGPNVTGTVFVLALSLPGIVPVAEKLLGVVKNALNNDPIGTLGLQQKFEGKAFAVEQLKLDDLEHIATFGGAAAKAPNQIDGVQGMRVDQPAGPLQHLSGIQFYFDQDLRIWRGHTQYLDSAWGLTSISQPQFWNRIRAPRDQYRSLLSVDIGIFDRYYKPKKKDNGEQPKAKKAWECTAAELAEYVWEQIEAHHDDAMQRRYGPNAKLPRPIAYAVDGTLTFGDPATGELQRDGAIVSNGSPFLVNKTGQYPKRPGQLNDQPDQSKCISRYDVILDRYVLAGTYMKTFTRLTSMEAANESARHAVNALLQKHKIPGDRCDIWDPEDYEPDDLQWLKDLDDELYRRGLPHFSETLGWDEIPKQFDQLQELAKQFSRAKGAS